MDTLALITPFFLPAFLVLDLFHRAHPYRATKRWRLRGFVVSAGVFLLSTAIATFWAGVFDGVSLIDGRGLGIVGGAAAGILVYEVGHYAYHRVAHRSDWLWRWGHQMHHSAESLDAWGANYLSPLDTFAFTTIGSLVFFPLLGLRVEAGVIGAAFLAFNAAFQHANMKTPRWLGYLIQRPESHSLHHGRGVHAWNYADLPLVDMLFGTFANPERYRAEVGFEPGASARVGAMLIGRDVSLGDPPAADHPTPGRAGATCLPAARRAAPPAPSTSTAALFGRASLMASEPVSPGQGVPPPTSGGVPKPPASARPRSAQGESPPKTSRSPTGTLRRRVRAG
jgi:sterol desaturase/sphingolipid hydroxylase (fatty acid hydroxylase superfamily)